MMEPRPLYACPSCWDVLPGALSPALCVLCALEGIALRCAACGEPPVGLVIHALWCRVCGRSNEFAGALPERLRCQGCTVYMEGRPYPVEMLRCGCHGGQPRAAGMGW